MRMCLRCTPSFFLVHHADARGGSQRGGYRRKYRDDEVDDFLPKFFFVHSFWSYEFFISPLEGGKGDVDSA